jgi:hypothetical protein
MNKICRRPGKTWAYGAHDVAEVNIVTGVDFIDHAVKGARKPHARSCGAEYAQEQRKFE